MCYKTNIALFIPFVQVGVSMSLTQQIIIIFFIDNDDDTLKLVLYEESTTIFYLHIFSLYR